MKKMKKPQSNLTVLVKNKKYAYFITPVDKEVCHIFCEAAKIDQNYLIEDLPLLIEDLPNLIIAEQEYEEGKETRIQFRVTIEEKKEIEKKAVKSGNKTVSEYLRGLALKK